MGVPSAPCFLGHGPASWLALGEAEQALLRVLIQGLSRHDEVRDVLTSLWRTSTHAAPSPVSDFEPKAVPQASAASDGSVVFRRW